MMLRWSLVTFDIFKGLNFAPAPSCSHATNWVNWDAQLNFPWCQITSSPSLGLCSGAEIYERNAVTFLQISFFWLMAFRNHYFEVSAVSPISAHSLSIYLYVYIYISKCFYFIYIYILYLFLQTQTHTQTHWHAHTHTCNYTHTYIYIDI